MRFCCTKGDQTDGDDQPSRPTRIPDKLEADTTTPAPTSPNNNADASPAQGDSARPDLWKEAYESLDEDRQKLVPLGGTGSTTDAIDGVIEHTKEKYREWQKAGLRIPRKDGGEINIRDSSERILNAALQAKDLITNVMALDPTGKASAAWTVVSIGLTMAGNNIDRRDAMFESSEFLAEKLAYYALVDAHYRNHQVEGGQNLDRALLRVYTAILDYAAEVKKVQQESIFGRVARSIKSLADQHLTQLKATIEQQQLGAERWANFTNTLRDREQAQDILNGLDEGIALMKNVHSRVLKDEEKKVVEWVSDLPFSDTQRRMQGRRTQDTGNWLLESQEYTDWKASPGSVLWLPGVVGCGKSVLCSTVIRDIEELCRQDSSKSVGYWYFEFTPDKPQSVDSMMRSLIRQLSRSPVAPSVRECWEEHAMRGSQPSRETITAMLHDVVASMPGDAFVVVDALDECPPADKGRQHLLSLLVDLAQRHGENIHVLATGRPEQDITAAMGQFPTVNLEARLAKDVETFVRAALEDESLKDCDEDIKVSILNALLNTEERRFRWADLQITRFRQCPTDDRIRDALRTTPPDLESTYQAILDGIEEKGDSSLARQMLMLLAFPAGPLDLKTVASSAGLRSPAYVLNICTSSLLSVSDDDSVRLAHFSVKEFLVVKPDEDRGEGCRFSATAARERLASQTVDLLLSKTQELTEETAMTKPFLVYAAIYWHSHVAALGDVALWPEGLADKVDRLFTEPTVYFNWVRIADSAAHPEDYQWNKRLEECTPPIFRASEMSLLRTVDVLVNQGADPLQGFGPFQSPYVTAVSSGRLDLVDMLLKKNFPLSEDMVTYTIDMLYLVGGRSACDTTKAKLKTVIRTMWERGLLRDPSQGSDNVISDMAIRCAIRNNSAGLEIMSQLLDWRDCGLVSFSLPSDALRLATSFAFYLDEMLELLFTRCEDELQMPPTMFQHPGSLPWLDFGRLAALARRRPAGLTLHDTLVYAMAWKFGYEDMKFILHARPDFRVTEGVLAKGAENEAGLEVFRLLWDRREQDTSITEEILVGAARNTGSESVLQFLIDELGPGIRLTNKVMEQVIQNEPQGLSMMNMIWGSQKATFDISARTIELVVSRFRAPLEMLELLRNHSTAEVEVTEAIVCAAVGNGANAWDLISYLSRMQEPPIPVTENVLISAMDSYHSTVQTLDTLMTTFPEAPITDQIMARFKDRVDEPPPDAVLEILLDRKLVHADEKLLETVAGKYERLTMVLSLVPEIPITHQALVQAAKDARSIRLLLDKLGSNTPITEDIIIGATESESGWGFRPAVEAIIHRTGSAPITENVFRAALYNGQIDSFPWLRELRPDLDISAEALFDSIWQDADLLPTRKLFAFFGLAALHDDDDAELTDGLLEKYPYDGERKENYRFDELVEFLAGDGEELPISDLQRAAAIIVERCSLTAVDKFLESRPAIVVSDALFQAATRNVIANREELLSLLEQRRAG
ncbi:hypothetical protein BJX61DRAFT_544805 [Aspergillus egyptiacus]|nr:hypothetical protein BJX61DRAFT_544805 [Aspergillus egyptiacus]